MIRKITQLRERYDLIGLDFTDVKDQFGQMKTVSVSELKANPSRYLRLVQRGGEVQILVRGKPIARLVGLAPGGSGDWKARRQRLIGDGVLRGGKGKLDQLLKQPPAKIAGAELSQALQEERGDRV